MATKSYLVAPFTSGLQDDSRPWLLPEDAFQTLEDAWIFRGRVQKRYGSYLLGTSDLTSRLRISIDTTDGNGDASGTVPGATFAVGQQFSIGSQIFTVNAAGTPATLLDTGAATTATFNTTTGAYVFVGADATTDVYWYPAQPVMGLPTRESADINAENAVAFDTQFAYLRSASDWDRLDTSNATAPAAGVWTGDNADFYWTTNYRGATADVINMYVVNNVAADLFQYIAVGGSTFTQTSFQISSSPTYIFTCKVLIPFQGRLVALNTKEGATAGAAATFAQRARWCQLGDPRAAATSWLSDVAGVGGQVDIPTSQAIVSAEIIKNRLVVYCERSTWELVYTGDENFPFRWQSLNSELGAESTFSIVGFDKAVLGVGNVGVHECDGVNVARIDQKIPDEVFKVHNGNDGVERVYGVRDFWRETVLWTFPDESGDPTFPTRILLYNYVNNTWALFKDSITCFGYYQKLSGDITWAELGEIYGTWANWNDPWGSPALQSSFLNVIAGNQQGFTFVMDAGVTKNAQGLVITDMTSTNLLTSVDHNLAIGDYIRIEDAQGVTDLNDTVVRVIAPVTDDTFTVDSAFTGTYTGGGKIVRVSELNILTKQFNPGTPVGQQFRAEYIDFLLANTEGGEISLDYWTEATSSGSISGAISGVVLGDTVLPTHPEAFVLGSQSDRAYNWHRKHLLADAAFVQLNLYLSDAQLRDYEIATSNFELEGMNLYLSIAGRLTQ